MEYEQVLQVVVEALRDGNLTNLDTQLGAANATTLARVVHRLRIAAAKLDDLVIQALAPHVQ